MLRPNEILIWGFIFSWCTASSLSASHDSVSVFDSACHFRQLNDIILSCRLEGALVNLNFFFSFFWATNIVKITIRMSFANILSKIYFLKINKILVGTIVSFPNFGCDPSPYWPYANLRPWPVKVTFRCQSKLEQSARVVVLLKACV